MRQCLLVLLCLFATTFTVGSIHASPGAQNKKPQYLDPFLSLELRVDDLLSRMTLAEKIGQLNMPGFYQLEFWGNTDQKRMASTKTFVDGSFINGIGPGGGLFSLANYVLKDGAGQQAAFFNELQKIAVEKTRLKIPLLIIEEGTHGIMCSGATIFPEGQVLGSTWNMDLIDNVYSVVALEARASGIHQLGTLVIEPIRDPRLGRNQEAFSEDPYFCSQIAKTLVRAIQGYDVSKSDKAVAMLCHYPGQSQPVSGLERGAMEISERTLREVFLPPWQAGIKEAGALGVMVTYASIDGMPSHSSSWIMEDLLRGELGFKGLAMSEGEGVGTIVYTGLAKTIKEAAAVAANAGMDVSVTFKQGYFTEMLENVQEGKVAMETIDRSVRRVLWLKFKMGLFENIFVDVNRAAEVSHTQANQDLALKAAHEGIVLLKNQDNLLPLKKSIKSIAVIGPNADDERNQVGDYTSFTILQDVVTVLEGIRNKLPGTKIGYVKGCDVTGNEVDEIAKAVNAAKKADAAIVVIGENDRLKGAGLGTVGEGYDVATLEITGRQKELVQKVYATGTPTVVILINGRPLATPWISDNIPAIIEAWNPGEKGGNAIADILFGDVNPSGKLPVTVPRHAGQLPVYYNYKPSKKFWLVEGAAQSYADLENSPLYEFGFGLSYSKFEYKNLIIEPSATNAIYGKVNISLDVTNGSSLAGSEVVQLYIRDMISSVERPVKELKGFKKTHLLPGETKQIVFEIGPEGFQMLDKDLHLVVEPGGFAIMVGSSSEDIRLEGKFEIYKY